MVTLYTSYFEKRYNQKYCSCVTLSVLVLFLATLIIPYIVTYVTGNMWRKQNFYFEQPNVVFNNQIILEVLDSQGKSQMYSTVKEINSLSMNEIGVPLIKYSSVDTEANGLTDTMHIQIDFISKPEEVRNIKVYATFDYSLQQLLQIEMIGLLYLDIDTPNGASRIITSGDLKLHQSSPIMIDSQKRTLYNTNPFADY